VKPVWTPVRRVAGGDLNEAWEAEIDGRRVFVKTRKGAHREEFVTEARCLNWLAEAGALQVPELVLAGEDFLALEWVEQGALSAAGEEELGRGLAQLHLAGTEGLFGAGVQMHLGRLILDNDPLPSWPEFYARRRLAPLAHHVGPALDTVIDRIEELSGPPEPPARLHGDLWSGNVMAGTDGRPWLIDPVAYGGHREMDLAMLELFGPRRARVWGAYQEVAPLADGWERRVALWQLFPLLVHAELFGGGYAARATSVARSLI
jgi:fructosamine-3-kinase